MVQIYHVSVKQKLHLHTMNMMQSKKCFFIHQDETFLKLATKILQTNLKLIFTEELSRERSAVRNDNPLPIDYRYFSPLGKMTFKDKSRKKRHGETSRMSKDDLGSKRSTVLMEH